MSKALVYTAMLMMCLLLVMGGCSRNNANVNDKEVSAAVETMAEDSNMIETDSGLRYVDLATGEGTEAVNGMDVDVHYTLWEDVDGEKGRKIDSSRDRNQAFPFTVGMPGLIKGWNEGVLGMQVGTKRLIYIPSDLGYGTQGRPPIIEPNTNLIFEIELLKIK